MSASEILATYRDGKREPVIGPFTYVEALGLVTINQKLQAALKALTEAQNGKADSAADEKRRAAHYNACALLSELERDQ